MREGMAGWHGTCGFLPMLLVVVMVFASIPPAALAAGVVCRAANGNERYELQPPPSQDPFIFTSVDFDGRFRVSAQHLRPAGKVKTYVYDFRGDTVVLIHAAEYRLDDVNCRQHAEGFGLNKIYSRNYERELFLQCFAICD
jgi:hypothetical protein